MIARRDLQSHVKNGILIRIDEDTRRILRKLAEGELELNYHNGMMTSALTPV